MNCFCKWTLQVSALTALALSARSGEPTPPPLNPAPNPVAQQSKLQADLADTRRLLADLQGPDASKHAAAEAGLVAKGIMGYNMVVSMLNNPDAAIQQRARGVREKVEKHATELLDAAQKLQAKTQTIPLTAKDLEELQRAWNTVAAYSPNHEVRQNATQGVQIAQAMLKDVQNAEKQLGELDKSLAAAPPPVPLRRAALQLDRAQAFITLQRPDDAIQAANEGVAASGKTGRLTPPGLKILADMYGQKNDAANQERVCKQLLAEYPDSLETRAAYVALAEFYASQKRWDEAVVIAKSFVTASPLDEESQDSAYGLLNTLSEKIHDYPRAYGLAGWMKGRFPISRLTPDILTVLAKTSEYAMKDWATAAATYKFIAEFYSDLTPQADVDAAVARVKAKAAGTFPKEPAPGDEGPAGAFAQFLAAVRAQDAKALALVIPAADSVSILGSLSAEENDFVSGISFANFIVKSAAVDGDKAVLVLDYYDASSNTPKPLLENAVKENGGWKIKWKSPEETLNPDSHKKNDAPAAPEK